ncbi:hypothetical protein RFI_09673 [Reticulomyxa filosa]|uniref:Uncharacterized protein n=1 Tax=Reticulomyxa filosa TaxID=46433 RepID=X6NMI2_RETFI|nr:hypothetical protein RFI_09673 [Reticulomyxa filosa]|eukprot:ETO27460.1 hypothetical protein RFI_09673 [Reticulomyxa filosa]
MCDAGMSIFLLIAFVHKMKSVVHTAKTIAKESQAEADNTVIKTKNLIIKLTILTCVAVSSSLVFWALYPVISTAGIMIDNIVSCFLIIVFCFVLLFIVGHISIEMLFHSQKKKKNLCKKILHHNSIFPSISQLFKLP